MAFGTYGKVTEKLVLTHPVKKLLEIYVIYMLMMVLTSTILPLAPVLRRNQPMFSHPAVHLHLVPKIIKK
jgi:hypothetical protein